MHTSDSDIASDARAHRLAAWALFGFTLIVAGVTFVLSFHGLDGYGRTVARVGGNLSWLVPIGVDGLTLTAVAATFLLRNARLRVRCYAWSVFVVANGASVAGNLSHGRSQHLATDGMVGAAAWPILLALASHLAIVTRRALERDKPQVSADVAAPVVSHVAPLPVRQEPQRMSLEGGAASAPAVAVDVAAARPTATTSGGASRRAPVRQNGRQVSPKKPVDNAELARRRVASGDACSTVAMSLGVSVKTVERWTKDVRSARQNGATSDGSGSDMSDDQERLQEPQRINGTHLVSVN